jgi:integrase/recombinase XerD
MNEGDRALIDRFLDMMAAESGAARNTLGAYRSDLTAAAADLGSLEAAGSKELALLGERWGALAPSTVARRSAALRRFYGFLHNEGLRFDDP